MFSKLPRLGARSRAVVLAGGVTAILAAPIAGAAGEGQPLDGGARNPANDTRQNYTRETEIIANVQTYGTRQSNKHPKGGGAIYGCRADDAAGSKPCVRATNLNTGRAFEFNTNQGSVVGVIAAGNGGDTKKPFITNATGVATGLNADRVDGREGSDLLGKTEKAADADKLDGADSSSFARTANLLFARIGADGSVAASSGGVSASVAGDTFTVNFPRDVSECAYTVTENSSTATAGLSMSAASAGGGAVTVDQDAAAGTPTAFHIQVMC